MPGPDSLEVCDNGLCLRDRSRESASAWICAKLKIETRRFKKSYPRTQTKNSVMKSPEILDDRDFAKENLKAGGR